MPTVDIPFPDRREPGRVVSAWAWCPRLVIDAEAESITVGATLYNSAAAYAADAPSVKLQETATGPEYRAIVAANADLWPRLAALADALIQSRYGGTVVPAPPPEWATEGPDPED